MDTDTKSALSNHIIQKLKTKKRKTKEYYLLKIHYQIDLVIMVSTGNNNYRMLFNPINQSMFCINSSTPIPLQLMF